MDKKVFLIADINMDLTLQGLKRFPIVDADLGKEFDLENVALSIGGSGFNLAKVLNSFGAKINFYGKIGDDFFGNYIKNYLKGLNIGNSLSMEKSSKTGVTTIITYNSDRILLTYIGANEKLSSEDIDLEIVRKFDHLHISSYYLFKNFQPDIISILKYLKSDSAITISLDTGYDPKEDWQREDIFSMLKYIDIFFPNKIEALNITKKEDILGAVGALSGYCPILAIKLGPEGAIGKKSGERIVSVPAFDIEVKDTTCCGDSFNAGFLYSFLKGKSLKQSLFFGNACGAIQATKSGSYSIDGIKEVNEFINRIRNFK